MELQARLHLRLLSLLLVTGAALNLFLNEVVIRQTTPAYSASVITTSEEWRVPRISSSLLAREEHDDGSQQKQPQITTTTHDSTSTRTTFISSTSSNIELLSSHTTWTSLTTAKEEEQRITTPDDAIIDLWENSTVIPEWMKEYFQWHKQVRQTLNESNWQDYHYLLHRCVKSDIKCSGASDRLKAIPSVLLMAYQAKPRRVLFLAWTKPAPLEEFLVPPPAGFDWRLPSWLADKIELERRGPKYWMEDEKSTKRWPKLPDQVARIKGLRGSQYYNRFLKPGEATFEQVYHDVWSTVFTPSRAIQERVTQQMNELHLRPGEYVSAHVRALYVSDTRQSHEEQAALNCSFQIAAAADGELLPIYFASDSVNTTRQALDYGNNKLQHDHATVVVARTSSDNKEPVHLDRGRDFLTETTATASAQANNDWEAFPLEDYYDVFVDLFLLANARCVVYGVGGFGSWASLLSRNRTCSINHRETKCQWTIDATTI